MTGKKTHWTIGRASVGRTLEKLLEPLLRVALSRVTLLWVVATVLEVREVLRVALSRVTLLWVVAMVSDVRVVLRVALSRVTCFEYRVGHW